MVNFGDREREWERERGRETPHSYDLTWHKTSPSTPPSETSPLNWHIHLQNSKRKMLLHSLGGALGSAMVPPWLWFYSMTLKLVLSIILGPIIPSCCYGQWVAGMEAASTAVLPPSCCWMPHPLSLWFRAGNCMVLLLLLLVVSLQGLFIYFLFVEHIFIILFFI